jgi:CRP-like cAMP-binding protein
MPTTDMIAILEKSKVFQGLSDEDLKLISTSGNVVLFQKDEVIIKEGQTGHPLFIVIQGQVEVVLPKVAGGRAIERATRIKLSKLAAGDCIGEYSTIDLRPASASVVAIEPCELFEISRSRFEEIINSSDFLAKTIYNNLLLIMIQRARDNNRELDICFN